MKAFFVERIGASRLASHGLVIGLASMALFAASHAHAQKSVAVSPNMVGAPAIDLVYQGKNIDRDQAISVSNVLKKQGKTLSDLDPEQSDVWTNKSLPANEEAYGYPSENTPVVFDSSWSASSGIFRSRVVPALPGNPLPFQMILSLDSHAAMARASLLRKMGYPVPTPRWYKTLRVMFKDTAARDGFLDNLVDKTLTARTRWVAKIDEKGSDVVMQDVVLEPAQIDMPQYHWGAIPPTHLKGRRALRALIVPLVLMNIDEAINIFAWEFGHKIGDNVMLSHPYADSFGEATFEDMAWAARRIAALSVTDLTDAVNRGRYPTDVALLILQKTIARRNHMAELFNVRGASKISYDTRINYGAVKQGKLTQEIYPGYALRFIYNDPQSPLRKSELLRFFALEGLYNNGLPTLVRQLNKIIDVRNIQDVVTGHQRNLFKGFIDHIINHPDEPYSTPVGAYAGITGGPSVNWARNIVSGTYYGGDAKVQLVDSFAVQGTIGAFVGFDGIPKVVPALLANASLQRNYIHVRPVPDMKTALNADIKDLMVFNSMRGLADILDSDSIDKDPTLKTDDDRAKRLDDNVKKFLDELKEGEMFFVTDALNLGARGAVTIPILPLMDVSIIGFNPDLTVTAGASAAIMRRTMFMRTSKGIQVYVQSMDTKAMDLQVDLNWWINILRWQIQKKSGDAFTKAFIIADPTTPMTSTVAPTAEERKAQHRLAVSVRSLLKSNNTEVIEENYPNYTLEHDVAAKIQRTKFLRWKWYGLDESHVVKVRPPVTPEHPFNPADKERTLFSHRIVDSKGTTDYAFFYEAIGKLIPSISSNSDRGGDYPASYFLGRGDWRSVSTEAEITPGVAENPVTILEHHWGGWSIGKDGLLKILLAIQDQVRPLAFINLSDGLVRSPSATGNIFRMDQFDAMKKLELYEILSTLVVYKEGMAKVRSMLFPTAGGVTALFNSLAALEGVPAMQKWCDDYHRVNKGENYPIVEIMKDPYAYTEWENGKQVTLWCVKPWMKEVLSFRKEYKAADSGEKRMKWNTKMMAKLEKGAPTPAFLTLLGRENYFFQVKVSGFRTKDENGDAGIMSDAIGTPNQKMGAGIFREFTSKYDLSSYELYARYLSEGY